MSQSTSSPVPMRPPVDLPWMTWSGRLSGAVLLLALALVFCVVILEARNRSEVDSLVSSWVSAIAPILGWLAVASAGALVAWKQRTNPVGWLMLLAGLIWIGGSAAELYILQSVVPFGASTLGSLLDSFGWVTGLAAIGAILFLFPGGRPISLRWTLVLAFFLSSAVILAVSLLLTPGPLASFPGLENPFRVERFGAGLAPISDISRIAFFAGFWAAVVSVGVCFRRADARERQQLKWFGFGVLLMALAFLLGGLSSLIGIDESVFNTVALTLLAPPVAIAALQYRLWDLDLVVRDTITYGLLAAAITVIYLGLVAGTGFLVSASSGDGVLLIVLATAIAAVLLQPIREFAQRAAHHIVFSRHQVPEAAGGRIMIRTLGTFRVERDGIPLSRRDWQSRKARQLLKILVARRGRPVHREELIEILWPESTGDNLGNRLAVAVSTVRSTLDPSKTFPADHFIVNDEETLRLNVGHVDVDVERLLGAADRTGVLEHDNLEEFEALYRGPFLPDDLYEDWAIPLRDQVRVAWLTVLRERAESADSVDAALTSHLKILEEDPWDEHSHLAVVELHRSANRHGEARRALERYRARMLELDVETESLEPGES